MAIDNPYITIMVSLSVVGVGWVGKSVVDQGNMQATIAEQVAAQGQTMQEMSSKMGALSQSYWKQDTELQLLRRDVTFLNERQKDHAKDIQMLKEKRLEVLTTKRGSLYEDQK